MSMSRSLNACSTDRSASAPGLTATADTLVRLKQLLESRDLSLYGLAQKSGIPYSSLKTHLKRESPLSVEEITRICGVLGIPMSEFFVCWDCSPTFPAADITKYKRRSAAASAAAAAQEPGPGTAVPQAAGQR